jgi:hypothetical protein
MFNGSLLIVYQIGSAETIRLDRMQNYCGRDIDAFDLEFRLFSSNLLEEL